MLLADGIYISTGFILLLILIVVLVWFVRR